MKTTKWLCLALFILVIAVTGCKQQVTCSDGSTVGDYAACPVETPLSEEQQETETQEPAAIAAPGVSSLLEDEESVAKFQNSYRPSDRVTLYKSAVTVEYPASFRYQNLLALYNEFKQNTTFRIKLTFIDAKTKTQKVIFADKETVNKWLQTTEQFSLAQKEVKFIPLEIVLGPTMNKKGEAPVAGNYVFDVWVEYEKQPGVWLEYQKDRLYITIS